METIAYICPNNYNKTIWVIVSLATCNSETKEEFISLKGLCESTYSSFCKAFVDEIKEYNQINNPIE